MSNFELIKHNDTEGDERWSARDLMIELGYARWENFKDVIAKAIVACETTGFSVENHFRQTTKMIVIASGTARQTNRPVIDYDLSRYACYLIAQNGDPAIEQIASAQTYFAFQTRKQEVMEENKQELVRLNAREKLSETEKKFSGVLFEQGIDGKGIAQIRARGDRKLFGGNSTDDMKKKLKVPKKRPLADFLPAITLKAKDLATEMTTFKTKEKALKKTEIIAQTHESHNQSVRGVLVKEGIKPEYLPAEEDIKKLERKIKKEQKLLQKSKEITDGKA